MELHLHSSPHILQAMVDAIISGGARQAAPGEFSRRAFINGKLDLAQAEAIADLINSDTETAAQAALQSLRGDFSRELNALNKQLTELRVYVEAALDFPQEEIDFLANDSLRARAQELIARFDRLIEDAYQGSLVNELREVVILGEPNVGKSSLLNALSRQERAIVSHIAGTTRDLVQESINLQGMTMLLVDTAGIRSRAGVIEEEGIRRAWQRAETSDFVLLIYDARRPLMQAILKSIQAKGLSKRTLLIANKIDLLDEQPSAEQFRLAGEELPLIRLSVKMGMGIDLLMGKLVERCGRTRQPPKFSARRHQVEKLKQARTCLDEGYMALVERGGGELFAEDLKRAGSFLGEILGEHTSEELLDKIFAGFCIGK